MFWSEEDIQPAVDMAVEMFGVVGNISAEKTAMKNVVITSDKFGHLWYGDIETPLNIINEKCSSISQKFNIQVSLVNIS